jgi:hypothetical protein
MDHSVTQPAEENPHPVAAGLRLSPGPLGAPALDATVTKQIVQGIELT